MGNCAAALSNTLLEEDASNLTHFHRSKSELKLQICKKNSKGEPTVLWIRTGSHPQRSLAVGKDGTIMWERWYASDASECQWNIVYMDTTTKRKESDVKEEADAMPELPCEAIHRRRVDDIGGITTTSMRKSATQDLVIVAGNAVQGGEAVIAISVEGDFTLVQTADGRQGYLRSEYVHLEPLDKVRFPALCCLQNAKTNEFISVREGKLMLSKSEADPWGIVSLRAAMTPGQRLTRGAVLGGAGVALGGIAVASAVGAVAVAATVKTVSRVGVGVAATTKAAGVVSGVAIATKAGVAALMTGKAAIAACTAAVATISYAVPAVLVGVVIVPGATLTRKLTQKLGDARDTSLYVEGIFGAEQDEEADGLADGSCDTSDCQSSKKARVIQHPSKRQD